MSNDHSSPISIPSSTHSRRVSLSHGLSFTDLFSKSANHAAAPPSLPNSMATAAANAQSRKQRRLSLNTLGLSGSPTRSSPFVSNRFLRPASISSSVGSSSANLDEAAIEEDNENNPPNDTPPSPFSRRVSFGAQALRDARGGSIGNGRHPSPGPPPMAGGRRTSLSASTSSIHTPSGYVAASTNKVFPQNDISNLSWRHLGEGFNWSEALRTRAERAPSLGAISPTVHAHSASTGQHGHHQRVSSTASMEQPIHEIPRNHKQNKPDFFQEKILRGDFMD